MSNTLKDFNIHDAERAINIQKEALDLQKNEENLSKICQNMSEFIMDSDIILLQSNKPFKYIFDKFKTNMYIMMNEDQKFRDNCAYLLRQELFPTKAATIQETSDSSKEVPKNDSEDKEKESNQANNLEKEMEVKKLRAEIESNMDFKKASPFLRSIYFTYRKANEDYRTFKVRFLSVPKNVDPRLYWGKPRRKPKPNRGRGGQTRGVQKTYSTRGSYNSGPPPRRGYPRGHPKSHQRGQPRGQPRGSYSGGRGGYYTNSRNHYQDYNDEPPTEYDDSHFVDSGSSTTNQAPKLTAKAEDVEKLNENMNNFANMLLQCTKRMKKSDDEEDEKPAKKKKKKKRQSDDES